MPIGEVLIRYQATVLGMSRKIVGTAHPTLLQNSLSASISHTTQNRSYIISPLPPLRHQPDHHGRHDSTIGRLMNMAQQDVKIQDLTPVCAVCYLGETVTM